MFNFRKLSVKRPPILLGWLLLSLLSLVSCATSTKRAFLGDTSATTSPAGEVKTPSSSGQASHRHEAHATGMAPDAMDAPIPPLALSLLDTPQPPPLAVSARHAPVPPGEGTPVRSKGSAMTEQIHEVTVDEPIPFLAGSTPFLMSHDEARAPLATYTVTMTQQPVSEVLFALARDAELNVDIYSGITDRISINAVNQTLPAILDRITEQANLHYQIKGSTIIITPDTPFRRNYQLDYLPAKRTIASQIAVSTHVESAGAGNNSQVTLSATSEVDFWEDLVVNIERIIGPQENEKVVPVVWNRATGIINVLATTRQHKQVQSFFDRVMRTAMRQVFIEATVVSLQLSDQFQAGVDWSLLNPADIARPENAQSMLSNRVFDAPSLALQLTKAKVPFLSGVLGIQDLTATVRMLSQFGNAKVISTPKITVLNNQTAVLRVTTNEVYFRIRVTPSTKTETGGTVVETPASTETQSVTVPIGFIMQVTPQIDDNDVITMNIRPTLQRISKWVDNPDPNMRTNLGSLTFTPPQVPVVQVQEMDSILRVPNGQVAIMGGLMEDTFVKNMDGVPFLSKLPFLGSLFSYRKNEHIKKELIIFLRPILITDAHDMHRVRRHELYSSRNQPIDGYWGQIESVAP